MNKLTIYVKLLFLILSGNVMSDEVKETESKCEQLWGSLVSIENNQPYSKKILAWESEARSICEGDDDYDYGLARLYLKSGEFEQAMKISSIYENKNSDFSKEFKLIGIDALFLKMAEQPEISKVQWKKLGNKYFEIITEYPDWYGGYKGVGSLFLALGDYEKSIKYSVESARRNDNSVAYRNMTVAFFQLDEFDKSQQSADLAFRLDKNLFADRDYMLAYAGAAVNLNKFELCQKLLSILLTYQPEIKNDEGFLLTGNYLKQKMNEFNENN